MRPFEGAAPAGGAEVTTAPDVSKANETRTLVALMGSSGGCDEIAVATSSKP